MDAAVVAEGALLDALSQDIRFPAVHEITMEPIAGGVTFSKSAMPHDGSIMISFVSYEIHDFTTCASAKQEARGRY